ncbi:hypothetical protein FA13DRAFT_1832821 [Coprinellus micaceus]|uniref:Uncharacterized protein n=1 Tax=Coprinellus micaceus TaxID=71717 RepID=A0A4Y7SJ67_COPMI|nr:hypothetical protein FA13DRAFT_1832821 [Coprinellus micaceus]
MAETLTNKEHTVWRHITTTSLPSHPVFVFLGIGLGNRHYKRDYRLITDPNRYTPLIEVASQGSRHGDGRWPQGSGSRTRDPRRLIASPLETPRILASLLPLQGLSRIAIVRRSLGGASSPRCVPYSCIMCEVASGYAEPENVGHPTRRTREWKQVKSKGSKELERVLKYLPSPRHPAHLEASLRMVRGAQSVIEASGKADGVRRGGWGLRVRDSRLVKVETDSDEGVERGRQGWGGLDEGGE